MINWCDRVSSIRGRVAAVFLGLCATLFVADAQAQTQVPDVENPGYFEVLAGGLIPDPAGTPALTYSVENFVSSLALDAQGRLYFERGEYQTAARMFENAEWKAIAFYKAGDFTNAAELFAKTETATGRWRASSTPACA